MMILSDDYTVRYAPFPITIPALTVRDDEGYYNIYINCYLSADMLKNALAHEIEHLVEGDFESQKPIEDIEPYRSAQEQQPQKPVAIVSEPPKKAINFSIVAALTGKAEKIKIEKRQYPCIDIWADELDRPPLIFRSLQK